MCLAKNNSIFSDTFHRSTFFFAFLFSTLLFSFSSSVINSSAFLFISCKTIFYGNHSTWFDWVTRKIWEVFILVSIIQTYRPWTPRRTSGRVVNKKIWRKSEAYRNFGKWIDWSLAIKRHIVMAAPLAVTAPSSVQNLMKSSSRRFDGKSRSLDDRDFIYFNNFNIFSLE